MDSLSGSTTEHDHEPVESFEWRSADGPSGALITTMSGATGDAQDELDPLYIVVDPDALDSLFARTRNDQARVNGSVSFEYNSYWVVINATGRGYLYESDEHAPSTTAPRRESREQSER